jgi:hypothetical protein
MAAADYSEMMANIRLTTQWNIKKKSVFFENFLWRFILRCFLNCIGHQLHGIK